MKYVFILTVLMAQLAQAATLKLDAKKSQVEFVAKGRPALISITGTGAFSDTPITLENDLLSGSFKVVLADVTTGINLRDEHLKEKYLEVKQFPEAVLILENVSIKEKNFKGKLLLHGVEKEVSGTSEIMLKDGLTKVNASFVIKLSDFKVAIPSFQGITVAENVTINSDLVLSEVK